MGRVITEPISITIPHKPFTKKNNSRIIKTKSGVPMLIPSESYVQYERDCGPFIRCKGLDIDCLVGIKALFYIDADRRCDLSNYMEAIADILVHYHVIKDDNRKILDNWDGSRVYVDREKPRTEITITPVEGINYQLGLDPEQLKSDF